VFALFGYTVFKGMTYPPASVLTRIAGGKLRQDLSGAWRAASSSMLTLGRPAFSRGWQAVTTSSMRGRHAKELVLTLLESLLHSLHCLSADWRAGWRASGRSQ